MILKFYIFLSTITKTATTTTTIIAAKTTTTTITATINSSNNNTTVPVYELDLLKLCRNTARIPPHYFDGFEELSLLCVPLNTVS